MLKQLLIDRHESKSKEPSRGKNCDKLSNLIYSINIRILVQYLY